ncbi:RNA polymerase sigma factor [Cohnella phaseoli]|nr:sigma factor [Cohnella phaseoli]
MFEQYYATHKRKIDALAYRYSRPCPSLHDDYVSVLAERLWRCYERGHEAEGLIYVALKRAAIDFYRSRQTRTASAACGFDFDMIAVESAESAAINFAMVSAVMAKAPDACVRAMVIAYYRGSTIAEIADAAGVHHEIVRRKLRRLAS